MTFLATCAPSPPSTSFESDASSSWGAGAVSNRHWFQLAWESDAEKQHNIATLELVPIVISAAVWGKHWQGQSILCRFDNLAVVHAIHNRSCRDSNLMHLLRTLFLFESYYHFSLCAEHIARVDNTLADDLSRNNLSSFVQRCPLLPDSTSVSGLGPPPQQLEGSVIKLLGRWESDAFQVYLHTRRERPAAVTQFLAS